ncbi:MAG TPA: hypothetical protein VHF51_06645, partial [Solirubrobacteraceae bacterium]|nr:hypothetical protein [Solirubrobacteraceae bacterium]
MRIPVAAVAALLAWMLPAAADGAVVQVDGTAAVFTAQPGEQNEPYIFGRAGGGITVAEFAAPIEPGLGCHYTQDEHWIDCPGPIALVRVHLGDGDDFVQVDDLPAQAYGEDGHDYLQSATALPVRFEGGPGDDQLFSGDGADVLIGGAGQNDFRAE